MKLPASLARPFRALAFDWDGTAVASRADDATPARRPIERLLRAGVLVVVITGTNFPNVDSQLSRQMRGRHKRNLHIATNRGSEVYGFDEHGHPVLVHHREATGEENRLLSEIAEAVRCEIHARTGLELRVVHDRMNRRKIDVIPVEDWADPPKDKMAELLDAVEARFSAAGLPGGLHHVFETARRVAREKGLARARITSDIKHVEVGLTDKSDSVAWVLRELIGPRAISHADLLIGGDEFGPVAGFPGSDSRMMIPEAEGAAFVSVGPEPGGAPPPVAHLGGGPRRFVGLLEAQAAFHPVILPATPTPDPEWTLVETEFVPAREHEIESLFAVGNGRLGCRAALAEGTPLSSPATFVAGVFDIPFEGAVPDLVQVPIWTHFSAQVDGQPIRLEQGETLEHRRILDMRQGMFWREWRQRDPDGRITALRGLRLASQSHRDLLLQSVVIQPENYGGRIAIERSPAREAVFTTKAGAQVAVAVDGRLERPEGLEPLGSVHSTPASQVERVELDVQLGKAYRFDRIVSVVSSRESHEPAKAAQQSVREVADLGVVGLMESHRDQWLARWRDCDLRLWGDSEAQLQLRFAMYHLLSASNPDDERVSIGARALTGPAYKGHVFWDTEIFMLPFFVLTYPRAARALLMYRYHTLEGARAKATKYGFRGAMFPWESADTGEEVTPDTVVSPTGRVIPVLAGLQEHHISADIAYAVWNYWKLSGDDRFLLDAGAEVVLETARFWASRVSSGSDDLFHILEVIGPDEYHEGVDDNAFTNVMAQWNLRRGVEVLHVLRSLDPEREKALTRKLDLSDDELRSWENVADRMYTGFDASTGIFEQFRGYHALEWIDLGAYEHRTAPMDVILDATA